MTTHKRKKRTDKERLCYLGNSWRTTFSVWSPIYLKLCGKTFKKQKTIRQAIDAAMDEAKGGRE